MANFVNTTFEKPSYVLTINSNDKINGSTNHDAIFQINWDDFLPREVQKYKVTFSFQTAGGAYTDGTPANVTYSSGLVCVNWGGRSFGFDTTTKGSTQVLGSIQRDIQVSGTTTNSSNNLSTYYLANAPRTISRPNQNNINIRVFNTSLLTANVTPYSSNYASALLTNTNGGAATADMTAWIMLCEFIPLKEEVVRTQGADF